MVFWFLLAIFILSCFVGYFIVWGVTPALHSPLMSVSNAISGIVIIGALVTAAYSQTPMVQAISISAVFFSFLYIFGGFAVSQRMLAMFKKKDRK